MKGICFKEDMFRAVIAGTKTQTRRIGSLVKINNYADDYSFDKFSLYRGQYFASFKTNSNKALTMIDESFTKRDANEWKGALKKYLKKKKLEFLNPESAFLAAMAFITIDMMNDVIAQRNANFNTMIEALIQTRLKSAYTIGEIIYLKEPYHLIRKYPNALQKPNCREYVPEYAFDKADHIRKMGIWKNKLFMPKCYARYFIKITNIRVERLNQITEADAHAEGFENIAKFQNVWITIHGWSSLKANPWVWVYEFELVTI